MENYLCNLHNVINIVCIRPFSGRSLVICETIRCRRLSSHHKMAYYLLECEWRNKGPKDLKKEYTISDRTQRDMDFEFRKIGLSTIPG